MIKKITIGLAIVATSSVAMAQTTKGPQPSICNRSCWSARAESCSSTMGALNRAVIHHSAATGDHTTNLETGKSRMRGIQNYHMDSNGWCGVGYNFVVSAGGHIFEGRSGSMTGLPRPAQDGCNTDSFGFNVMGYYHPPYNQSFTAAAQDALYDVIAWRMPAGWSPYGSGTYCGSTVGRLAGHRNVKSTACPGDVIYAHIGTNFNGGNARNGVAERRTPSAPSKTARTVDNNSSGFSVVGSWATNTSAPDKHGADYRYKSTAPVSEPATWATTLNVSASWTVRAWWPAGANRSATAPYIVSHGGGTTTVNKNQQTNGGSWQTLGTWSMGGAQNVKLSCWTTTGFVVMADAVRWE